MLRLRFISLHLLLSQKMLTNLSNHFCNMLAALLHATPSATFRCAVWIFIFSNWIAQHPPTFAESSTRAWRWLSNWGKGCKELRIHQLGAAGGVCCLWTACCWDCVTLTSPRGPGSPIHPVLRWCTVCRHIPGCCVCSGPRSSGTPDSSCPAGTYSTTHQPPSHLTLYHLKYI